MTPEEKARIKIDQWFADAGWKVINRDDYEPTCTAVAIREGLLKGNLEADYFLFINGKAVGVLEAKREETDAFASKVCEQAALYAKSVPNIYQTYQNPLPFIFTSNGKELYFCDFREKDSNFKQILSIPTPRELVKELGIEDTFAGLPTLKKKGLRDCQYEAVTELEKSFRTDQKRALMVLATGAGKTYTACLAAYRMLSYTPMRRVLFLVDRNNLGKQAENEFGTFRLTENGDAFNTIFTVNRLRSSSIPSDSNVVISTIQRLFSFLKGEDIEDSDDDDDNEPAEEVTLPPNPNLPHDYFDMIIIDECHRSIYGNWRKVLEYFDTARLVGLTATPIPETMAFFNNNRIVNYTLEKSILDGVNVDCRIYRIKTQVTENGGAILEGERLKEETRYTGEVKTVSSKEARTYTNKELNRSIINPAQIKLILSTYKDVVYKGLNPNAPMKDSGVEWIGKVPEHWKVMKTSLAFTHIGSGTTPSTSKNEYYEDDGDFWLQTGDLTDGIITDTSKKVSKIAIRECNLKFYPTNSVVIAMYGATIGKMGLLQIECATNQACCVLPSNNHIDAKFTFYFFLSAKTDLLISAIGGGQPNISQDVIKKTKMIVPPLSEQQTIANYLDEECTKIDVQISNANHRIELLNELKQSIITEAVTGKIKIC